MLGTVGSGNAVLCRSGIASLHDESQKRESMPTRRTELVDRRARITDGPDELHRASPNPRTTRLPKVSRVVGGKVSLAEVAQHDARAERLDLVVRVTTFG
jgi:hypothetical protein